MSSRDPEHRAEREGLRDDRSIAVQTMTSLTGVNVIQVSVEFIIVETPSKRKQRSTDIFVLVVLSK